MEPRIKMFNPLREGDEVNFVAMHPLRWAAIRHAYGIVERDEDLNLVGFNVE